MNATTSAVLVGGLLVLVRGLRPASTRLTDADKCVAWPAFASRRRRSAPAASEWATFLDTACAEVRSGSSLIAALAHARIRHPGLAARIDASDGRPDPDLAIVKQSISATLELGGPVAATLHHGAALLRERAAQHAEARAHSAQAWPSAKVLTAVPLLFAVWSAASSAGFRHGSQPNRIDRDRCGIGQQCNRLVVDAPHHR